MATIVPIEDIQAHPLFIQLTERQRNFTLQYIETQDNVKSVRAAGYSFRLDKVADILARKNLKHPVIKQLIGMALGYEATGGMLDKKELLLLMSERLRTTRAGADFTRLCTLYTSLRGWLRTDDSPQEIQKMVEKMESRRKE